MSTIQIRIDEETKAAAKKVLDDLGLDLSTAIKLYLKQVALRRAIPFELTAASSIVNSNQGEVNDTVLHDAS